MRQDKETSRNDDITSGSLELPHDGKKIVDTVKLLRLSRKSEYAPRVKLIA